MSAGKAGAYPRVEPLKVASHLQALAVLANIKLDWKGLPGTNTLAFDPGKPFQPSLMFAGKAGTYPRVEHLKADSLG